MKPVSDLYGRHVGADIYVVGTGASMRVLPLAFLEGKITIGLNMAWQVAPISYGLTIGPHLHVPEFLDGEETHPEIRWVTKADKARVVLSDEQFAQADATFYGFEMDGRPNSQPPDEPSDAGRVLEWVREPTGVKLYQWSSISQTAVNLAANMGARNVILVGCDNCALLDNHHSNDQHTKWSGAAPERRYQQYYEGLAEVRSALRTRNVNVLSLSPFLKLDDPEGDFSRLCGELDVPRFVASGPDISEQDRRSWPAAPATPSTAKKVVHQVASLGRKTRRRFMPQDRVPGTGQASTTNGSKAQVVRQSSAPLDKRSCIDALPRHVLDAIGGDRETLNDDLWSLLSSARLEVELDQSTRLTRVFRPFEDEDLFGTELGPFQAFRHWEDFERVGCTTRTSFVEPGTGWVISEPMHLIHRGVIDGHDARRPRIKAHVSARLHQRVVDLPEVINLRDRSEENYGHFLTDLVGGRLRLAGEAGLGSEAPILVSRRLYQRPFFQDFLRLSDVDDGRVLPQDEHLVRSDLVFLFDTSHYSREAIGYVQSCLSVPDSDPGSRRRILVAREPGRTGRAFTNMDDVSRLCKRLGFELVSTDHMPLPQQMELFSETGCVVGVSGSALSNILFRRNAPLHLLEIFPPGAGPPLRPWWFYMAAVLGHRYDVLHHGVPADGPKGRDAYLVDFAVDVEQLESRMSEMLEVLG